MILPVFISVFVFCDATIILYQKIARGEVIWMDATDMEKMEQAENASKELVKLAKEKQALEKKISGLKRIVTINRNRARTHIGMNLYGKIIVRLGLTSEEKACSIRPDFEKLQQTVLTRIDSLLELERIYNEIDKESVKSGPTE